MNPALGRTKCCVFLIVDPPLVGRHRSASAQGHVWRRSPGRSNAAQTHHGRSGQPPRNIRTAGGQSATWHSADASAKLEPRMPDPSFRIGRGANREASAPVDGASRDGVVASGRPGRVRSESPRSWCSRGADDVRESFHRRAAGRPAEHSAQQIAVAPASGHAFQGAARPRRDSEQTRSGNDARIPAAKFDGEN